jgi:2-(1,2-epoxy-1,2-dihydrophenyl)acetyl-CoA isomerase
MKKNKYINRKINDIGIAEILINDPVNKNAVNFHMNQEIINALLEYDKDPKVRVIILSAVEDIFCGGGNIKKMIQEGKALEPEEPIIINDLPEHISDIRAITFLMRNIQKPIIGAINGPAVGSGVGLAAACDIRIANDKAKFAWVFAKRGILPDDGSLKLILDILGYAKTFQWAMTASTFSAIEAKDIGFVNEVTTENNLMNRCYEVAELIASNVPPMTANNLKQSILHANENSLSSSMEYIYELQKINRETKDAQEALAAYKEKRKPRWLGK